jgi:hypothetical protein
MSGSFISSMRTPQMTPVTKVLFGCSFGALAKKLSKLVCFSS